jgi:hypothetical protein
MHCSAIKMNDQFMLFREVIAIYSDNDTKHTNELHGEKAEFLIFKAGGTYSNHLP